MLRDWIGLPLGMLPAHHIKIYRALRARLLLEEKEPGLSNSILQPSSSELSC